MEQLPRTRYSQEFREQSVKFFKESGLTLVEAAKRLSLPKGTLNLFSSVEPIKTAANIVL
ncbi:hypothetical protein [Nitrosomonas sp. Nm58]|uniref:hypothetical protein n=1 Tax=Nitrosomonas sp. Nm58 TaxID=200126 RepID=UPI00089946F7|nr:hypothetical protein [Nitrosomonas sp. Nm58]SDZ02983.1 transposase [Nitrosomonas sp. Nm58]